MEEGGLEAIRITNALYLGGKVAPFIQSFVEKVNIQTITYETLYTYFANSIQLGGDRTEFWVVLENNEPVAFAHWLIRSNPHVATAYGDFVHIWNRKREPANLLLDKFIEFGKKHRCVWFMGDSRNESIFRVMRKGFNARGIKLEDTNFVHWLGR